MMENALVGVTALRRVQSWIGPSQVLGGRAEVRWWAVRRRRRGGLCDDGKALVRWRLLLVWWVHLMEGGMDDGWLRRCVVWGRLTVRCQWRGGACDGGVGMLGGALAEDV